ncbi:MAG: Thiamine pyrophosphokinase [Chlamydiales bacterium]|nr:Thiamine pyrophosphokinase [Chlamydiales bacterium]
MQKILVIANGEPPSHELFRKLIQTHSYLVAVDGGLLTFLEHQIDPHLITGDFDSLPQAILQKYAHIQQIYTPNQSKSDLEKALELLDGEITVLGALGARIDHALTNICLLCRYPGKVKFETESQVIFSIPNEAEIPCQEGQTLSLMPVASEVLNVKTSGLKWNLNKECLNKNFVSLSNICVHSSVTLSYTSGSLVVCMNKNKK